MAYVDQKSPSQRAASLASAAILQGGVAAILIYGLATTVLRPTPDRPMHTTEFPLPPVPVPTEQPTETRTQREELVDAPQPKLNLDTAGPATPPVPPTFPTGDSGSLVRPPAEPPLPPPPQLFKPTSAKPLGDRSRWVTTDDYPASELRRDHSGTTGYRVSFAANGKVTGCEVVTSSGWPKLDEAACANVSKRARFEPGTDTSGAKAAGSYSGSVVWTIPR